MAVTVRDLGEGISLVTMAGKSATQSFSMEFLPKIAEAIQSTLSDASVKAVVITCLLYTSPSPRDGLLSRMPSSA